MEDLLSAPVAIPTLNRIEHLTRCLESLEYNTRARNTDVYISVDYPPSEKYFNGYEEVLNYLESKKKKNGFKSLIVYYQENNLGPAANIDFLLNIIRKFSDVVITTEDDNEFSINFLDYINKGLEIFKEDERVVAICGCKETEWYAENSNVVALQMYPAYGVGIWFNKNDKLIEDCNYKLLNRDELSRCNFRRLKKEDRTLYNFYIISVLLTENRPFWVDGKLRTIDTVKSIYMHLTNKFSVVPMVGKSRTWGNDGSGVNMESIKGLDPVKRWPLDSEENFSYVINMKEINNCSDYNQLEFLPNKKNHNIESKYMSIARSMKSNFLADIGLMLLKLCDYDSCKAKKIVRKFKK